MFSDWFTKALERRNWTVEQLARRVADLGGRVSKRDLADWHCGKGKRPSAAEVVLLARTLGESPGEALIAAGQRGPSLRIKRLDGPLLIGVTGGTGSGKTFVSTWIIGLLGRSLAERVEMDWYYRAAKPGSSARAREARNYDLPAAYEIDRLVHDLGALKQGRSVAAPQYDFTRHTRGTELNHVRPAPVIVVEGIFLFHDRRLRDLFDLKLFVEAPRATRFQRRLQRDQLLRGRSAEEVQKRFNENAQPGFESYIEPTREFADLILINDRDDLQLPRGLEVAIAWIRKRHRR